MVGAGPTGVELAGALGEIANDTLKDDFRAIRPEEARILLLDGAPRVLTPFEPELSEKAENSLIRLGVRSMLNVKVIGVDRYGVRVHGTQGEQYIGARTVLWAAGVTAAGFTRVLADRAGAELDRGGRVIVDRFCNIPGHPEIYVIGDASLFKDEDGKPLPGVAPTAMQQGSYVASAIRKRVKGAGIEPFKYFDKGDSCGYWPRAGCRPIRIEISLQRDPSVAAVVVRSPDVSRFVPEPRDRVYSLGFQLHHVQPRRTVDYRGTGGSRPARGSQQTGTCRSS